MSDIYLYGNAPTSEGFVVGELHAAQVLQGDILGSSFGAPDTHWMYSNSAGALAEALADAYDIATLVPDRTYAEDFGSALVGATLRRIMQDLSTNDVGVAIKVFAQGLEYSMPHFRDRSPEARAKCAAAKALRNLVLISNVVS